MTEIARDVTGVTRKQLLNRRFAAFVAAEHLGRWNRHFMRALQYAESPAIELVFQHGDSSALDIRLDCRSMETEGEPTVRIALTDITQRKQAEKELLKSETRYRSLFESSMDAIMLLDEKKGFFDCNAATLRIFGCPSRDDFLNRHPGEWSPATQPCGTDSMTLANERIAEAFSQGSNHFEWMHKRLDGADFPADVLLTALEMDGKRILQGTVRDISEYKQMEEALKQRVDGAEKSRQAMLFMLEDLNASKDQIERGKKEWEATFDAVNHPIFLHDSEGKIVRANRAYAEKAGMPLAQCIGRPFWKVFPKTKSRPEYCNPDSINPDAMNSLPVAGDVEITDGDLCYMVYMYPMFDENNVNQFSIHVMEDITRRKMDSHELEHSSMLLKASLEGTIQAMSNAVEVRDPYTAGHQKGASKLAVALARQMHLDADRIRGIELGALIHDIGEIGIPAEMLCKPGKLSSLEYRLIKEHPEVGFGILKDIVFPWPVADIAHQHHERLDGSGYPQGLKAEAICLEARIVAVADVVEAMLSHRPYRDALGLEAVMDEISRNSGKLYDPTVVEACLAVFAGGFQL